MLEPVGLDQQVVDQVDAEVDVLEPGQRLGASGFGVALAVEVDRVPAEVTVPEQRAGDAAAEKISFQPWWRSSGSAMAAARAKRFAL